MTCTHGSKTAVTASVSGDVAAVVTGFATSCWVSPLDASSPGRIPVPAPSVDVGSEGSMGGATITPPLVWSGASVVSAPAGDEAGPADGSSVPDPGPAWGSPYASA